MVVPAVSEGLRGSFFQLKVQYIKARDLKFLLVSLLWWHILNIYRRNNFTREENTKNRTMVLAYKQIILHLHDLLELIFLLSCFGNSRFSVVSLQVVFDSLLSVVPFLEAALPRPRKIEPPQANLGTRSVCALTRQWLGQEVSQLMNGQSTLFHQITNKVNVNLNYVLHFGVKDMIQTEMCGTEVITH